MAREFPLAIVVSAVDRATKPIREINKRVARAAEPVHRLNRSLGMLAKEVGLNKLAGRVTAVGSAAGRVGQEFWRLGRRIGLFAVGAGAALFGLLKQTSNAGDSAMKMARRLGVSVEWLQAFRFAAERSGIAMATVDMAVQRAGRRIGEFVATGRGEAMPVLQAMGFTREQLKTLGSIDKILPLVFAKLSQVKDANVRNAMAMKLFDSEGVAVVQMLENGVEGIDALMAEARRLGLVLSEDAARGSERFNDGLTDMMGALKGVRNVIATTLMPVAQGWIDQLTNFLVESRPRIQAWARDFMRDLPGRLAELKAGFDDFMSVMRPLAGTITGVIERLGGMRFIAIALAVIMGGKLLFAIFGLAKALVLLGASTIAVTAKLSMLLWPALLKLAVLKAPLMALFAAIGTGLTSIGAVIAGVATPALLALKGLFVKVGAAILATPIGWIIAGVALLAGAAYLLIRHWEEVKTFFAGLWDGVTGSFGAVAAAVVAGLTGIAAVITGVATPALAALTGMFAKVGAAILATPIGWIIAGVAAVAGAAYLLIKHWGKVKEFFADLWDGVLSGLNFVIDTMKVGFKRMTGFLPDWAKRKLGIEVEVEESEPQPGRERGRERGRGVFESGRAAGVEQVAPQVVPGASARRSEAHVTVDFENMPRGARVRQAPDSDADLDLNLGYSMVTP